MLTKLALSLYVVILAFISWCGPAGFSDNSHWLISFIALIVVLLIVLGKRYSYVHGIWLLTSLIVGQQMYRQYAQEKWSSGLYKKQLDAYRELQKAPSASPSSH